MVLTTAGSRHLADTAVGLMRGQGVGVTVEELPDGEPGKRLDAQEPLFRRFARQRLERGDPVIALGDDALLEGATLRPPSGSAASRSSPCQSPPWG